MENNLNPTAFDIVFAEKSDIENNAEYTLSEYMQNISHIVKTDAKIKITDKEIFPGKISVSGEVVYDVLYVAENSGKLKCVVFKKDFLKELAVKNDLYDNADSLYVAVKISPANASAKLSDARNITAHSKFSLYCEVVDMSDRIFCLDDTFVPDCTTEYLRKDLDAAVIRISDRNFHNISESFEIDGEMPEISDIIDASADVCVKNIVRSEGLCKVDAEMTFNCLYEAKNGDDSEYVSLERAIPFSVELESDESDSSWSAVGDIKLVSLSADSSADNFGEQKVIDVNAGVEITLALFKNSPCTIIEDMYSTECCIEPDRKNVKFVGFENTYNDIIDYTDRIHFDLHSIVDIISSSLRLSFGNPEFSDGRVYIPARGVLGILGLKENGEADARTSQITLRIPAENISPEIFDKKLRWLNYTSVCHHECSLASGELVLHLGISENLAAFIEESENAVLGYEKSEDDSNRKNKKCGFTVYFPEKGESVWNAAKTHFVSCERLKAENAIEGDSFDGKKAIVMR